MNVAVLLAGIADPKWPLDARHPRILSPFDECALEVALQIRDARPETFIAVLVAGDEALARSVLAHRPDVLRRVELAEAVAWDARALAAAWKSTLDSLPGKPDLVLSGREFGDRDDGAFAPSLAARLGCAFVGLAQSVRAAGEGFEVMRERGTAQERIERAAPLGASVTNDRGNRLRHPLMKNVMAARRAAIESAAPLALDGPRVTLEAFAPAAALERGSGCRMLEGSFDERIAALASYLGPWRAAP